MRIGNEDDNNEVVTTVSAWFNRCYVTVPVRTVGVVDVDAEDQLNVASGHDNLAAAVHRNVNVCVNNCNKRIYEYEVKYLNRRWS